MNQNGRTARGYGYRHQELRKWWKPKVDKGEVNCARCGLQIVPGTPWHLDHTSDRTGYLGPSHKSCNLRSAGRKGARVSNPRRRKDPWHSRDW